MEHEEKGWGHLPPPLDGAILPYNNKKSKNQYTTLIWPSKMKKIKL